MENVRGGVKRKRHVIKSVASCLQAESEIALSDSSSAPVRPIARNYGGWLFYSQ